MAPKKTGVIPRSDRKALTWHAGPGIPDALGQLGHDLGRSAQDLLDEAVADLADKYREETRLRDGEVAALVKKYSQKPGRKAG